MENGTCDMRPQDRVASSEMCLNCFNENRDEIFRSEPSE